MTARIPTDSEKLRLRAVLKAERERLGAAERARVDALIAERACAHEAFARATAVFTYLSVGAEVDTRAIIGRAWDRGLTVAVPRCVPDSNLMQWYRIRDFGHLERGRFGIEEPLPDPADLVSPPDGALAVVPGLSFDADGYRLGYGGGFYDAFLPTFPGVSLGLCRAAQLSDRPLPRGEYDIPVDFVITEAV